MYDPDLYDALLAVVHRRPLREAPEHPFLQGMFAQLVSPSPLRSAQLAHYGAIHVSRMQAYESFAGLLARQSIEARPLYTTALGLTAYKAHPYRRLDVVEVGVQLEERFAVLDLYHKHYPRRPRSPHRLHDELTDRARLRDVMGHALLRTRQLRLDLHWRQEWPTSRELWLARGMERPSLEHVLDVALGQSFGGLQGGLESPPDHPFCEVVDAVLCDKPWPEKAWRHLRPDPAESTAVPGRMLDLLTGPLDKARWLLGWVLPVEKGRHDRQRRFER